MERKIYKDRTGEVYFNNQGYRMTIIECFGTYNNTVQFEDGNIRRKIEYSKIKRGRVKKHFSHEGEEFLNNQGLLFRIIGDYGWDKCIIEFENGYSTMTTYTCAKAGSVSNPYHPSVYGVGYLGVGKYIRDRNKLSRTWDGMLERSFCKKYKIKKTTYQDVTVCEEWHNFQNFGAWYEENFKPEYMQGWHLDKDILIKGNKVYSPETCCFVPQIINALFVKNDINRGEYPIGVNKKGNMFKAILSLNGKHLYKTAEEAFQVYKEAKEVKIKKIAEEWRGKISDRTYEALINYQVEITD